jgi:hypothetical protein
MHLKLVDVEVPTEYRRSFDAFAAAFREAGRKPENTEVLTALVKREREIELAACWLALRSLTGLIARKTGDTPRSILEAELTHAPSDDFWRATLAGHL